MFIDQPFVTLASVGTFHFINACASAGTVSKAFCTSGSSFVMSKLFGGPIAPKTHRCLQQFGRPTRPMGPPIINVAPVNIGQRKKNLMEKKTIR